MNTHRFLILTAALLATPALAQTGSCAGTLVKHAMGEACVPKNPQKIVALEWTYAEDLLALGIQPHAIADTAGYREWVRVPVPLAQSVQDVGTRQQPSIEKLTALKPDLIITSKLRASQNYGQLSAIAPTLVFDPYASDIDQYQEMRQTFSAIARAVGREAQGKQVLANLDAKLNEARATLAKAGRGGETFALSQAFTSQGSPTARLFTKNAMASQIIERLGLKNAWGQPDQPYGFSTVSLEGLATLNTKNFLYIVQEEDNVFVQPAHAPLWNSLAFVKNDRAYSLGSRTWLFGGPLAAQVLAEQVTRALTTKR